MAANWSSEVAKEMFHKVLGYPSNWNLIAFHIPEDMKQSFNNKDDNIYPHDEVFDQIIGKEIQLWKCGM